MITYEILYDALYKEKNRDELQKLDDDFFSKAFEYLKEKESIFESQKNKKSKIFQSEVKKTQKQIENTKKILRELYEKREKKVLLLALSTSKTDGKSTSGLLEHEKKLYKELVDLLNRYRENFNLKPKTKKEKINKGDLKNNNKPINNISENIMIKFTEDHDAFVDPDLKEYGPFKKGDSALIPKEIANLLINENKAIEDEISKKN